MSEESVTFFTFVLDLCNLEGQSPIALKAFSNEIYYTAVSVEEIQLTYRVAHGTSTTAEPLVSYSCCAAVEQCR